MNIKRILPFVIVAFALLASCGGGKKRGKDGNVEIVKDVRLPGDSTVYGLACDGCTDSVLVLLPSDDSDPVTYNIISAMRNRKVFGRPRIGDQIAVVVNKDKKHVADIVIDLEELKGSWVYLAQPKMRKHGPMPGGMKPKPNPEQDSMMQALMVPREQGFKLKKQYMMQPIGLQYSLGAVSDNSPVEYPQVKYYTEWNVLNGRLVFTEGTIEFGNKKRKKAKPMRDTVDIVLMMKDSLQLRFKDGVKSYYRKN